MAEHRKQGRALHRFAIGASGLAAAALGALASGWAPAPGLAAARAEWAAEAAQVDASLTEIEDRLLVNQARVRLWEEMRSRHQTVSQVACESLGEHARAMVAASSRAREHVRTASRGRVAAAPSPAERGVGGF